MRPTHSTLSRDGHALADEKDLIGTGMPATTNVTESASALPWPDLPRPMNPETVRPSDDVATRD